MTDGRILDADQIDRSTFQTLRSYFRAQHSAKDNSSFMIGESAVSASHAKAMVTALYEVGSVLSFEISESELPRTSSLPLHAEQLAKKSVKDAKARDAAAAEAKRLSKKIVTAQHKAVKDAAARFKACQ